ncbi:MAG: spore germination protein GerW family protein [bacterium]|nr:spore germination protein GerW family protein [bacterium]
MATSVDALIERVLGELNKIVQTRTVVGEPLTAGSVTLIPVSKISLGFAAGGGTEGSGRSGTGGGATVEPIGFVVIDGKGKVQVITMKEKEISWGQLVELVPDAVSKVKSFVERRSNKDADVDDAPEAADE